MRIQPAFQWERSLIIIILLTDHAAAGDKIWKVPATNLKISPKMEISHCSVSMNGDVTIMAGCVCSRIPKDYPINGTTLHIKNTAIASLMAGDLDLFANITTLTIELNPKLNNIFPGTFDKMHNIVNLSISNNNFLYMDRDMFRGLTNLKHIKLNKNNNQDLYCISMVVRLEILPSLISLDVSENHMRTIEQEDTHFLVNTRLKYLRISMCSLDKIEPTSLNNLLHLEELWIDNNNLDSENIVNLVSNISLSSRNFSKVHMGANCNDLDLNFLLNAISHTQISHVDLSDSLVSTFFTGNISSMPNIVSFDFSKTSVTRMSEKQQTNPFTADKLPNIEYLNLAHIRMLSSSIILSLPKLKVLDLTDVATPNGYSQISAGNFNLSGMSLLESLRLDSNSILSVRKDYFEGLTNLKELYLSNGSITNIELDAFSNLGELEVLDLSHNVLVKGYSITNRTFTGLHRLKTLYLQYNQLSCIDDDNAFINTPNLEKLILTGNNLMDLHHNLLSPVGNLKVLDLSYNNFQNWDVRMLQNNHLMEILDISFNQITAFTPAMLDDFKEVKELGVVKNTLSCMCSDIAIIFPFVTSKKSGQETLIRGLNASQAYCSTPRSVRFSNFLEYAGNLHHTRKCSHPESTVIIIILMVSVVGFFAVGLPTVYFLRWHIKYWVFLGRQAMSCYIFPKKRPPEPKGKYVYDAFVSYSNEDRLFVVRLVSMLESHTPFFHLCVFERDFNIGGVITDNVMECLEKSRRTILILSDSFARSTWCQWEMKLAEHKRLFFKDDQHGPLIIIKIGEIMDKHMTPTLRYLIKTRIYLQWNSDPIKQKVFWEKLRSALKAPLNENEDGKSQLQHSILSNGETMNKDDVEIMNLS